MNTLAAFELARVLARSVRAHALGGRAGTLAEAVRRAACVYGSAPTCHLSVQSRAGGYAPRALDDAVMRTRDLVRVRAMRGSVYLVPRDLVPHALELTAMRPVAHYAKLAGIEVREYAPLARRIEKVVGERPRTAAEIRDALGRKAPEGAGLSAILGRMGREGRIVRAEVRGGARSQSYEYARMADWMSLPEERPSKEEALRALASLWLAANGPATSGDLAWWAGVSKRDAGAALAAIGVRAVKVKGLEGEIVATPELLDDLARAPEADDEVHLLPLWDSYLMAHEDRRRYLDAAREPYVVDPAGNVTNVVLRGGRVAGVWDLDGERLLYAPFGTLPSRRLEEAAGRLAPLHRIASVEKVAGPRPLAAGGKSAFLAPLRTQLERGRRR